MRRSRLEKFRKKNIKLIITTQILLIWYVLFFSLYILTTDTVAYFSSNSEVNSTISTADDWWDKSSLAFTGNGTQVMHSCPPTEISVEIKNIGLGMTKSTVYEVYYSEKNGNPEKHGEKIVEGLIQPIEANMTIDLIYEAEDEGWYIFKALQRLGFDNDYENKHELWSEKIKVQCNERPIKSESINDNTSSEEEQVEPIEINIDEKEAEEEVLEISEEENGVNLEINEAELENNDLEIENIENEINTNEEPISDEAEIINVVGTKTP